MRFLPIMAGMLAAVAPAAVADPVRLLAPDDPATRSGWRPPPSPTADLKDDRPVDAEAPHGPDDTGGGAGAMPGMPGMEHGR